MVLSAILHSVLFNNARFFFNDTATTEIYTLSLHDTLPIFDVSCNGSSDGSMTVTFGGGTGPYQVSLDGGAFDVATSPTTFNGLSAILHSVTVKDARNCTPITSQTISQPPLLTASSTKVDVSCNGSSDGSMTVTFGGGTGPYQVSLDGGAFAVATSPATFNGLSAILHSVTVQDARSCTANTSQTISPPPLLTASSTKLDVSCN